MPDIRRAIRKLRWAIRWEIRRCITYFEGSSYALTHLKTWAESTKAAMEEIQRDVKAALEDSSDKILWLVIGSALTSWARMEEPLVLIFSMLLRTKPEKAGLILYSTINFSVWINIIDELFAIDEIYLPIKPKWNNLAARMRRVKDDRDRIAHHGVQKPDIPSSTIGQTVLQSPEMDVRQKSLKSKPMSNHDVLDFVETVNHINRDLVNLANEMAEMRPASPEKSAELSPDQGPVGDAQ